MSDKDVIQPLLLLPHNTNSGVYIKLQQNNMVDYVDFIFLKIDSLFLFGKIDFIFFFEHN